MTNDSVRTIPIKKKKKVFQEDNYFSSINVITLVIIAIITLIASASEVFNSEFLRYLGGLFFVIALFFVDYKEYPYLLVAFQATKIPLTFFSVSLLNFVTIIYFLQKFVFKKAHKEKMDASYLIPIVVLVIYAIRAVFDEGMIYYVSEAVKVLLTSICFVSIISEHESAKKARDAYNSLMVYFTVGFLVSAAFAAITKSAAGVQRARFAITEASGKNQLGILAAFGCAFILLRIIEHNSRSFQNILIALFIGCVYVGFATQSRTFTVLLLIALAWIFAFGFTSSGEKRNKVVIYISLIVIVSFLLYLFGKNTGLYSMIEETIDRFINPRNDDISGARFSIGETYIKGLTSNSKYFWLGVGKNYQIISHKMAHNMYLEIWSDYGIFGFVIIIWVYASFAFKIRSNLAKIGVRKMHLYGALPLIMTMVAGFASHSLLGMTPTIEYFLGIGGLYFITNKGEEDFYENTMGNLNEHRRKYR